MLRERYYVCTLWRPSVISNIGNNDAALRPARVLVSRRWLLRIRPDSLAAVDYGASNTRKVELYMVSGAAWSLLGTLLLLAPASVC